MKVYQPGTRGKRTQFVQPGSEFPNSDFMDEHGKPRFYSVVFIEGEATVDDQIGQYMIDKGIAKRSPILLPGDMP